MSEELDPEVLAKSKEPAEEDPLAELARIVAGEPEPEDIDDESVTSDISESQTETIQEEVDATPAERHSIRL